ncbi:MAG TPA: hypothetical protein PLH27_00515 [bacterium]|nr:hypothetical protein [bacterium]HMW32714.1 hypothetical protein [bacterium]HMY35748.1 hypothetical protein [bacterium]HMZ03579.1 hypothetical protein [bacterium]HNB55868.1 hypothetical protein [bacterium]
MKWFYVLLFVFVVVFSYCLLQAKQAVMDTSSIEQAVLNYHTYAEWLTYGVPAAFLILLILANFSFTARQHIGSFVYAFLFFIVFTIADYVFLNKLFFEFLNRTGQWRGGNTMMGVFALLLCVMAGGLVLANYLIRYTIKKYKS